MSDVKINIDLATLKLEVEGPADFVRGIFDTFLQTTKERSLQPNIASSPAPPSEEVQTPAKPTQVNPTSTPKQKKDAKKGARSFEFLGSLFDPTSGRKLKEFFESKKPVGQKQQAIVLMRGMQDALGRKAFTYDELFTAFRTVGVAVPKSLPGVMANLRQDTHLLGTGDSLSLHYTAEDFVDQKLPAPDKVKK